MSTWVVAHKCGRLAGNEISLRIMKARAAFSNLQHQWHRCDLSLSIKGRVYNAAVRSILLYGTETWPLRAEDVRRLSVLLEYVGNAESATQKCTGWYLGDRTWVQLLRWLGEFLRMPSDRLPRRVTFYSTLDWVEAVKGRSKHNMAA